MSTAVAKNMMATFWFQLNAIKGGASRPQNVPRQRFERIAVLGLRSEYKANVVFLVLPAEPLPGVLPIVPNTGLDCRPLVSTVNHTRHLRIANEAIRFPSMETAC